MPPTTSAQTILDTPPEKVFDTLTKLVTRLLHVPVALVTILDEDRQFFKSQTGLPEPWATRRETPLSHSFCQHVVATSVPLIVEDARTDPRVRDNLAIPDLGVIAYLGVPLFDEHKRTYGALCAISDQPRQWTAADQETLETVATQVMGEVALRAEFRAHQEAQRQERLMAATVQGDYDRLAAIFQQSPSFLAILRGPEHVFHLANDQYQRITGHRELLGKSMREALPELAAQGHIGLLDQVFLTGKSHVGQDVRILLQNARGAPLKEHFVDLIYQPTFTVSGSVDGIVVHGVDWTERKHAVAAFREGEEQFRSFVAATADTVYKMSADWKEMYHLEGKHFLADTQDPSRSWLEKYIPAAEHPAVLAAIAQAIRRREPFELEHRVFRADGSVGWTFSRAVPMLDAHGEISEWIGAARDITDEKQGHERLRQSEEKYRSLFDSIDEAFAVLEIIRDEHDHPVDYRFVEVNPAMERHTGWKDARGKTARELIPNLEAHWPERYGRVERTGEPVRFVQGAEGMGRVFDAYAFRIGTDDHPQVAILFQDVTEQRASAAALAQLSEQRGLALDSAQLGWWHYDAETGLVDWDERSRTLYGSSAEHISTDAITAMIHPDDLGPRNAAFRAALASVDAAPRYEVEYRVKHPDGSWRWIQIKGKGTVEGEGAARRVTRLDGTVADITQAKSAQEALRESEDRFRQLADALPQMMWTARPDGFIDYYNDRWYEYTGGKRGDYGDESWQDINHPEDFPIVHREFYKSVATGTPFELEFRLRNAAAGQYRWFLTRAVPVRDADGNIVRWIGTNTDTHERRELQRRNEELLESERAARSEAERVSQMKDEFLATLSHELRTPLNAILGWTQVLRGDPSNVEDVEAGLVTIERNAKAQTQIIEDLLDMSKIISGKVRLDVQPLHLDQVVTTAVDTMRPAAAAKNIRLQTLIDPQARMISGDPNRLQQVFWNLLSNALKFTPKGGKVQVVLERVDSHLEVAVADTGEGIAPDFLPYVFDRFRQQDASTTRRHGGLGLGLAIVKQLVELHGGSISVESAGPGQGTTFRARLPLSVVQASPEQADLERRHPQVEVGTLTVPSELLDLAGVKVLVVDDEVDARSLIKRLLEDRKAAVCTAGSVAEALTVLKAERPDVLVSDIGMPEEDGYTLIQRVRALKPEEGGGTPAVALTAYARAEDRLKAIFAGFQMHVSKPVNGVELLALVANLAGRTGRF